MTKNIKLDRTTIGQIENLSTLVLHVSEMNPEETAIINRSWEKTFPDRSRVAHYLKGLVNYVEELEAQKARMTCHHGFEPGAHTMGKIGCKDCMGRDLYIWELSSFLGRDNHAHQVTCRSRADEVASALDALETGSNSPLSAILNQDPVLRYGYDWKEVENRPLSVSSGKWVGAQIPQTASAERELGEAGKDYLVSECEICLKPCGNHNHPQRAVPASKWYGRHAIHNQRGAVIPAKELMKGFELVDDPEGKVKDLPVVAVVAPLTQREKNRRRTAAARQNETPAQRAKRKRKNRDRMRAKRKGGKK